MGKYEEVCHSTRKCDCSYCFVYNKLLEEILTRDEDQVGSNLSQNRWWKRGIETEQETGKAKTEDSYPGGSTNNVAHFKLRDHF